jgi:hypothetical protein
MTRGGRERKTRAVTGRPGIFSDLTTTQAACDGSKIIAPPAERNRPAGGGEDGRR